MDTTIERTAVLALVGALAVTAGCLGAVGLDGPTATPDAADTATGTGVAATPTASAGSPTASEATGTTRVVTATSAGPNFLDAHATRLRAAGNVTVRTTTVQTVEADGRNVTQTQVREALVDFESGRVHLRLDPLAGDEAERYRNESGASFTRLGPEEYLGPDHSRAVDINESVRVTGVPADAIARRGTGTVDGVEGTVYAVDSVPEPGGSGSFDAENVTAFELTYVVDDAGYVAYQRVNVTITRTEGTLSRSIRRRFVDVGSTDVSKPEWLREGQPADTGSLSLRSGPTLVASAADTGSAIGR